MTTDTPKPPSSGVFDFQILSTDLEGWYARVIVRMFYPNTAASVAIAMPENLMQLQKGAANAERLSTEAREMVQRTILFLRDGSAALVAQGVSGTAPDYRGFVQFQKYYTELLAVLRGAAHEQMREQITASVASPTGCAPSAKGGDICTSTASPKSLGTAPDAIAAFAGAHSVFQEDTPLKRYVRHLKSNRGNGKAG